MNNNNIFTPKKIVEELNRYIISQDDAKKSVAIALRNRYRRKNIKNEKIKNNIIPKNIILIGPTGVGKTEIARRLAKIAKAPFIKVEATKYTEVGYVGKDVESMIKELVETTFRMVKEEKMEQLRETLTPIVYEKIAKKIAPYYSINDEEKAKLIEEIKKGNYDDYEIEIDNNKNMPILPVIELHANGSNIDEAQEGLQGIVDDLLRNITGQGKQKKKKIKVKAAFDLFLKEEIDARFDKEDFIPEVIERVEQDGIVFIDEIDKIAEREGTSRGEVSRQGVQRDILPIVEGTTVMTKYGPVRTDYILFIAAGAFSVARPSDLMPELQGRFPVRVNLKSLNKEDFIKILTEVDNNLIEQYKAMLLVDGVNLEITPDAIEKIAEYSIYMNEKVENIGARRLATVLEDVLADVMYEAPDDKYQVFKVDGKYVEEKIKTKVKKEEIKNYIL